MSLNGFSVTAQHLNTAAEISDRLADNSAVLLHAIVGGIREANIVDAKPPFVRA